MVVIIALAFRENLNASLENKNYDPKKKAAPNGATLFKITYFSIEFQLHSLSPRLTPDQRASLTASPYRDHQNRLP